MTENITLDETGTLRLGDIADAAGEDCITVVDTAVLGQETYKSL